MFKIKKTQNLISDMKQLPIKEKDQISIAARRVVLHAFGTALEIVMQHHGDSDWNTWVMELTGTQTVFLQLSYGIFPCVGFSVPLPLPYAGI